MAKTVSEISVNTETGGHSGGHRADTPVGPDIPVCIRQSLRWEGPGRQEHTRGAIWAEKLAPKLKIEGANDGIRLWERKGR